jgi:hypothetical protein
LTEWNIDEVKNFNEQFEKSFLLRFLVHVIGDIHQPLHSSSLVNDIFPNGDLGGNLFKINYSQNIDELHKLFDSGADKLGAELKRVTYYKINKIK